MRRRDALQWTVMLGALAPLPSRAQVPRPATHRLTLDDIAQHMADGRLTAAGLTADCLQRIERLDRNGPALRSILQLNPDAAQLAASLDAERRQGKVRGPLHGVPIVVKDSIATGDRMPTTMGSLALAGVKASHDAPVVARLRAMGALILGKSNLTEWCNARSPRSIAGWSAVGGLTRNPHNLERVCGGSSSGSAAAVAAGLVPVAVGTESDGSIVCPASICGIVGIKPTVGLVAQSGMLVVSDIQDTAGAMGRTVRDTALLLEALAAPPDGVAPATARLDAGALAGKRLGVPRDFLIRDPACRAVFARAVKVLRAQGAAIVDVRMPNQDKYGEAGWRLMVHGLKHNLAAWLAEYAPSAPVRSLADVIAFNEANADRELALFGQEFLIKAQSKPLLDAAAYEQYAATVRRYAGTEGIAAVLAGERLDALIGISSIPGWPSGGRPANDVSFTSPAAAAGYPHVTVPAGMADGMPVGLSFVGGAWRDAEMLGLAYAFEQAAQASVEPLTYLYD